jgi:hypothetical protein
MTDPYVEMEKRLAELLGWTNIQDCGWGLYGRPKDAGLLHLPEDERCTLPRWCHDWSACGPLMVDHGTFPEVDGDICWIGNGDDYWMQSEPISDHPDRDTAVRFAIVQAVIAKLEAAA